MSTITLSEAGGYYSMTVWPELYRDWFNNFLTVDKFAEAWGMSLRLANDIIDTGRATDNFTNNYNWEA